MRLRIVSDIKENTDLTRKELEANIPDLDPISTTDVTIRNYIIRYFRHKEEIVATYVKTLKTSKKRNLFLLFLEEEMPLLSDIDVYTLYKSYKDKAFTAYVDENNEEYSKYSEYAEVLREEILQRCK